MCQNNCGFFCGFLHGFFISILAPVLQTHDSPPLKGGVSDACGRPGGEIPLLDNARGWEIVRHGDGRPRTGTVVRFSSPQLRSETGTGPIQVRCRSDVGPFPGNGGRAKPERGHSGGIATARRPRKRALNEKAMLNVYNFNE